MTGLRGHDGRALPADPRRAGVARVLADPVSQLPLPVAELQVAAGVGRVRGHDVLHRVGGLLLPRLHPRRGRRARPQPRAWRKKLYSVIAMGWQGTDRQWHHFGKAYIFLAALATPLVLSVHSVVSWDFAMSIVPGWHATIFAPYFVAGAIFSGVAMVITLAVPLRKIFGLEAYLTTKHFDAMAKLMPAHVDDRLLRLPLRVLHGVVLR